MAQSMNLPDSKSFARSLLLILNGSQFVRVSFLFLFFSMSSLPSLSFVLSDFPLPASLFDYISLQNLAPCTLSLVKM